MLIFPDNWQLVPSTNTRVTHCFTVDENKVLITAGPINIPQRMKYIQFAQSMMHQQLLEEKHHIVEENVTVQTLITHNGIGYYFMATDQDWTPGSVDWPYLLRCMFVGKQMMVELTVLCHDKSSPVIRQALQLFEQSNI